MITWETAVSITVIVSAIVGAATAYLKLSISKAIADAKLEILEAVDEKYASKESVRFLRQRIESFRGLLGKIQGGHP